MYLDNAATSFPKPECVYTAMDHWMRTVGAAHGRGQYSAGEKSNQIVESCRRGLTELLDLYSARYVCFTLNCTDSLNLVLKGLLRSGDHVLATALDHNSVLRPLHQLRRTSGITFEIADSSAPSGVLDLADVQQRLLLHPPRLVVLNHASNVTGCVQPVAELTEMAHRTGALVLLDAAQTAGHLPLSMRQLNVDFLAAAGHKGLLGPLGTGILAVRPGLELELTPARSGGTGTFSQSPEQPEEMPDRFESGNLNLPGIAGLRAGVEYLLSEGVDRFHARLSVFARRLITELRGIEGVHVYPEQPEFDSVAEARVAVVSFNIDGIDCREAAAILDSSFDIQCRAGLHCAPLMHQMLGTTAIGGAIRFSPGFQTTEQQVDVAVDAVRQIASAMHGR